MTDRSQIIEADWTWIDGAFKPNIQIVVTPPGRIEHVGTLDLKPGHRLRDRALIPGFINAHSHAFQRGLRGLGERFPAEGASFWTWREHMYRLVDRLDADAFYDLTHQAYREMLAAGITTVGEFHYLHHDESNDGFRFDEVVLTAAKDAGIRLVLLQTYYRTGGINAPMSNAQQRFATPSTAAFRCQLERLTSVLDSESQSIGLAAHSIRAVPPDDLVELHRMSREFGMVFHMHVEEQRQEIADCYAAYGRTPMALLNERLHVDERFTAVHGTHTSSEDMNQFAKRGGNICLCPLTEANLGDGMADAPGMLQSGANICLGTDSNVRISMVEEMRWLEYAQRLRHESRGCCRNDRGEVAPLLLGAASENGARSLGVPAGRIKPGMQADFALLNLSTGSLSGWKPETILDALIFGSDSDAIEAVCVGGRWIPALEPAPH